MYKDNIRIALKNYFIYESIDNDYTKYQCTFNKIQYAFLWMYTLEEYKYYMYHNDIDAIEQKYDDVKFDDVNWTHIPDMKCKDKYLLMDPAIVEDKGDDSVERSDLSNIYIYINLIEANHFHAKTLDLIRSKNRALHEIEYLCKWCFLPNLEREFELIMNDYTSGRSYDRGMRRKINSLLNEIKTQIYYSQKYFEGNCTEDQCYRLRRLMGKIIRQWSNVFTELPQNNISMFFETVIDEDIANKAGVEIGKILIMIKTLLNIYDSCSSSDDNFVLLKTLSIEIYEVYGVDIRKELEYVGNNREQLRLELENHFKDYLNRFSLFKKESYL